MRGEVRAAMCGLLAGLALACGAAQAQDNAAEAMTPEKIAAGEKLYEQNCAVCHGPKMVEAGGGFFDLRTFPPAQRNRFFTSVTKGKNSMPPWGSVLSQDDIGFLWAYVIASGKK